MRKRDEKKTKESNGGEKNCLAFSRRCHKSHKLDCYWGFFYYLIYIVLYA